MKEYRKQNTATRTRDRKGFRGFRDDVDVEAHASSYLTMSHGPVPLLSLSTPCSLLRSAIVTKCSTPPDGIVAADLFGGRFLERIAYTDGREDPTLTNGYLLVTIAYSIGVTGDGSKFLFLCLKERLLRYVSQNLQERQGQASLQCMGVILLLGLPIVCLLGQDLPRGLQIKECLTATEHSDQFHCAGFTKTAKESLSERKVHWRALWAMIRQKRNLTENDKEHSWLNYLSRYQIM